MSTGTSYATADLDEARAHVSRTFSEHDLRLVGGGLDFRLDLVPSARLTVGRMTYGADATLAGPAMRTCYHVNLATSGESRVSQHGRRETTGVGEAGVAFLPDGPLEVQWSPDAVQYALKFPKELLESHAAKLAGTPQGEPIHFDLTFDISSPGGRALVATAAFLHAELSRPGGLADMPLACHELEAALMTQLLMVVPSQFTGRLRRPGGSSRHRRIRAAVAYLDEHPERETSTADLAELAGIGPRALQAGFRDLVGMSPRAYLRAVRLDRVHEELARGGRPVTEVAASWGFYQPGHFARKYRERFGELPSRTAGR
ncbi:AraC family transcriptional regulator [Pseudonocardia sp. NPDC049154]|uniref:AraC family transcriptional regulator n=1 Tax=Pseudonocardia sp. NPDC049154 TaxID=3155501 RepID=UPI0034072B71